MMNGNNNRPPSVLAIDDDANILDIIKTYLEGEGFTVQAQTDPRQGVEWYGQRWREVDLVLLDYVMPEMNGEAVFERVRQVNPNARVLLLTACDDAVAKKLFEQGLRGYIQKPFYLNQLARQIQDTIQSS
jgi:DNA-binding response OmpR family regulator